MKEVSIFVCSFCKESFESEDAIACHMLNTHDSNKTVKRLREQLTKQNNRKPPKLKPEKNTDKQKGPPSNQQKVKKHGTEFYCDMCDYKTVYLSTYKRHLLIHEKGAKQHKCNYCSYAAIQPHNLKVHLKSVHPFGAVDPVYVNKIDTLWIHS